MTQRGFVHAHASGVIVRGVDSPVWPHYVARWGDPTRVAEFVRAGEAPVRIGKWVPAQTGEGVTIYASDGVSVNRNGVRVMHGYEVILGLSPEEDGCASSLAALATASRSEGIGPGHTFDAGGPLWEGTAMTAWLLVEPATELLPPVEAGDGHCVFLQVLPLYPQERTWKIVHGSDALIRAWQSLKVPFWDPRRAQSDLPNHEE